MKINRMRLINYRNYKDISPVFSPNINIIHGDNGQGKTNLLESIFLMSRGYSHRAFSTKELIGFDSDTMFCKAEFESNQIKHNLSIKAVNGKKGWKLDGRNEKSFLKIQNLTGCIIFEPNDLDIVKGGPEVRRRFINWEISGLIPSYRIALREYERIRQQRNALLKQSKDLSINELRALLAPWDEQFVNSAARIYNLRNRYLTRLSPIAEEFHKNLSGTKERLGLAYKTSVFTDEIPSDLETIRSRYYDYLQNELTLDLERGFTRKGPHNDDLSILVNDHYAKLYASQGQQRTAAISLKLAHIDLYKESLKISPIVLLDDILSELDDTRQKNILSVLEGTQTFITCTNPSFSSHLGNEINKILVSNGTIG